MAQIKAWIKEFYEACRGYVGLLKDMLHYLLHYDSQ